MSAQLKTELRAALHEIGLQEAAVIEMCVADDQNPYQTRYTSGEFILAPFISAKVQLLCALASLENK